jgi:hypothetical protein
MRNALEVTCDRNDVGGDRRNSWSCVSRRSSRAPSQLAACPRRAAATRVRDGGDIRSVRNIVWRCAGLLLDALWCGPLAFRAAVPPVGRRRRAGIAPVRGRAQRGEAASTASRRPLRRRLRGHWLGCGRAHPPNTPLWGSRVVPVQVGGRGSAARIPMSMSASSSVPAAPTSSSRAAAVRPPALDAPSRMRSLTAGQPAAACQPDPLAATSPTAEVRRHSRRPPRRPESERCGTAAPPPSVSSGETAHGVAEAAGPRRVRRERGYRGDSGSIGPGSSRR